MNTNTKTSIVALLTMLGGVACASSTPSPELVQARQAYANAEQAPDTRLVPAQLLTARQALDRAEAIHEDDPNSKEERSYAYIAQRQAELAMVKGAIQADQNQRAALEERYKEQLAASAQNAQDRLHMTRDEVENLNAQLYAQRQQSSAALDASNAELQRERERSRLAMESLDKIAQVKEEARGTVLTLQGQVLFLTGKSELLPVATTQLERVAKALMDQDGNRPITVIGHTDSRGSESMNQQLSLERAQAVRSLLIAQGVPEDRIQAVGKGESDPIATNETAEGRANNRRVEIVIGNPPGGAGTQGQGPSPERGSMERGGNPASGSQGQPGQNTPSQNGADTAPRR